MLTLPTEYIQHLKQKHTNLIPVVVIGGGDEALYFSTNKISVTLLSSGEVKSCEPLIAKGGISTVKEGIDYFNKEIQISAITIKLNNYERDGRRLSNREDITSLNRQALNLFWAIPTNKVISYEQPDGNNEMLHVYSGLVSKTSHDLKTVTITAEDRLSYYTKGEMPKYVNDIAGMLPGHDYSDDSSIPLDRRESPAWQMTYGGEYTGKVPAQRVSNQSGGEPRYFIVSQDYDESNYDGVNEFAGKLYVYRKNINKYCEILESFASNFVDKYNDVNGTNYAHGYSQYETPPGGAQHLFPYSENAILHGNMGAVENKDVPSGFSGDDVIKIYDTVYDTGFAWDNRDSAVLIKANVGENLGTGGTQSGMLTFHVPAFSKVAETGGTIYLKYLIEIENPTNNVPVDYAIFNLNEAWLSGTAQPGETDVLDSNFLNGDEMVLPIASVGIEQDNIQFEIPIAFTTEAGIEGTVYVKVYQLQQRANYIIGDFTKQDFYIDLKYGRATYNWTNATNDGNLVWYRAHPGSIATDIAREMLEPDISIIATNADGKHDFFAWADKYDWLKFGGVYNSRMNIMKELAHLAKTMPVYYVYNTVKNMLGVALPDGNYIYDTSSQLDRIIKVEEIQSLKFKLSDPKKICTKITIHYNYDWAEGNYKSKYTTTVDNIVGLNSGYGQYSREYYNIDAGTDQEVEYKSKLARDEYAAQRMAEHYLMQHCNQRLFIEFDLPLQYIDLEVMDVIHINKLYGGAKAYGIDYTKKFIEGTEQPLMYNGQQRFDKFAITETNKHIKGIKVKAMLLMAANAGLPSTPGNTSPGCTDPTATNYNPDATEDDGTCEYPVYGCADPDALNYDPELAELDNFVADNTLCEYLGLTTGILAGGTLNLYSNWFGYYSIDFMHSDSGYPGYQAFISNPYNIDLTYVNQFAGLSPNIVIDASQFSGFYYDNIFDQSQNKYHWVIKLYDTFHEVVGEIITEDGNAFYDAGAFTGSVGTDNDSSNITLKLQNPIYQDYLYIDAPPEDDGDIGRNEDEGYLRFSISLMVEITDGTSAGCSGDLRVFAPANFYQAGDGEDGGEGEPIPFQPGDVNLDYSWNVLDIITYVNHILDINIFTEEQMAVADYNGDLAVNVLDVVNLVNYILSSEPGYYGDGSELDDDDDDNGEGEPTVYNLIDYIASGDVNLDGVISSFDMTQAQAFINTGAIGGAVADATWTQETWDIVSEGDLEAIMTLILDMNEDGIVDMVDIAIMLDAVLDN